MKRFNFLPPTAGEKFARRPLITPGRFKPALRVFAAMIALIGVVDVVENLRLREAQHELAVSAQSLERSELAVKAVKSLEASVASQQRLARAVLAIQQSGLIHANDLAWIGNRLPGDTWLTSLRFENGAYALDGTADHVAAVARAMSALRNNRELGAPRLVTIVDDHERKATAPVHYSLQLETPTP